jgi:signal transduction histidine kinase
MKKIISQLLPERISGQIAILIVVSLIAIHAVITASILWSQRQANPHARGHNMEIPVVVRALAAIPRAERAKFFDSVVRAFPALEFQAGRAPHVGPAIPLPPYLNRLREHLGAGFHLEMVASSANQRDQLLVIQFPDEDVVTVRLMRDPPPFLFGPVVTTVLFLAISLTLLVLWAARALIRPLTRFANAAEGFDPDREIAPIPESGPAEIRSAAKALNQMHQRIKELVDDRTRMLAAVGHDLRTPITRLRLRSEQIGDRSLQEQFLRDLDQMRAMIDAALSYLRDGKSREAMRPVDIATLLQTACDQYVDLGHDAVYEGPDHFTIWAQPDAMQRAISNLIHNAVRYGEKANVRLQLMPNSIRIEVEDNGPGIPDADKAKMLEPFTRGDAARNLNDGSGFGLGLAIARTVMLAHGGTLTLLDRRPHGLIANIEIESVQSQAA